MKNFRPITQLSIFALFILSIGLSACVRVDGPQGPQGSPGRDGNANVISINYEVFESDWFEVGTPGENDFYMALDLSVPEIDQDIMDNGLVLAYYRIDDKSPWIALPYTLISHDPAYVEKLDFIYDVGFVGFQSQATDKNATPYEGIFKIIVASAFPVNKMEVDYTNYEEVAVWLGISEDQTEFRKP